MINIFVSHAWDDKVRNQFGQVCREFKDFNLWLDTKGLVPGRVIRPELKQAIEEADLFLVLWSYNAAKSKDVLFEIETACHANKPIVPCVIDDCPLQESDLLSGRLYFDLRETGDAVEILGWMKLKQHVLQVNYQKLVSSDFINTPERQQELKELEKLQQAVQQQISLLETTVHRIRKNADNRDRKNPYMLNMIDTLIATLDQPGASEDDKQTVTFLRYSAELFDTYPHDDVHSKSTREALMSAKISSLDPAQQNEKLLLFKNALNTAPVTPAPVQEPVAPAEDSATVVSKVRTITVALENGEVELDQLKQWEQWCREMLPGDQVLQHLHSFLVHEIERLEAGGKPVSRVDYGLIDEAIGQLNEFIIAKEEATKENVLTSIRKWAGFLLSEKIIQGIVSAYMKYLRDSPLLLRQLAAEAKVSEYVAVKETANKLVGYLVKKGATLNNNRTDHDAVNDAYMIHNAVQLLIKANLVPRESFSLDFVSINLVDKYVSFLIGKKSKESLDQVLNEIRTMIGAKKLEINWGQVAAVVLAAAAVGNRLYALRNQSPITAQQPGKGQSLQDRSTNTGETSPYVEDRIAALSAKYGLGINVYHP